ncbi:hypothetical protein HDU84_006505 [Entophlyctis sp. JEL0112]|nr:hypothetical protein HDU84_006505 [Entophlyctis sp. JEL0112]
MKRRLSPRDKIGDKFLGAHALQPPPPPPPPETRLKSARTPRRQNVDYKSKPHSRRPSPWPRRRKRTARRTQRSWRSSVALLRGARLINLPAGSAIFNLPQDDHLLDFATIQQRYTTSFNPARPLESRGLSAAEALKRLQENGPNVLTPPKKKSPITLYLECMGFFNTLLFVCGIAEFIVYGVSSDEGITVVYIGAILVIVANLNASIEFFQLLASQKALEGFLNMIPASCQVIRDGEAITIPASELVIGDVVSFRMGAKVPADVYIIQSADLKVDNSSLTGESEPQERTVENTMQNPLEATNLAFFSTLAVEGEAVGVVIRTGDSTVLGQIAGEI